MPLRGRLLCFGFSLSLSRRFRLFLYWSLGCIVLAGAFTAVFLVAGVAQYNIGKMLDDAVQDQTGIGLLGHAYNIDVVARQVQIAWLVLGCGDFVLFAGSYGSKKCGRPNVAADYFFDGAENATATIDPMANLWFTADTSSEFYIQAAIEIETEHLLEVTAWYGQDQQYAYPFDYYILDTFFQAYAAGTNDSLPTLFMRIADATSNFQPFRRTDSRIRTLGEDGTFATAHGAQYSFHRVALTRLFVMLLFILNWLLTAVVVYIAVSAFDGVAMSEGVLILPLSVILTIPALRALWADAPVFGLLLDSCGTFLQMVIVSLASIYLVVNVALRRQQTAQAQQAAERAQQANDVEKDVTLPLLAQRSP